MRARRANIGASIRSFLRVLSVINRTCRAFATIAANPNPVSKPLTDGECVPTSYAIRHRRTPENFGTMVS